jgi:hypothetical protein
MFRFFSRPSSGGPPLCIVPLLFLPLICVRWVCIITQYVATCVCHLGVFGVLVCWRSAVHKQITNNTKMTNKVQLCRIIYYSLAAEHVSSNIFAHHQEHLNRITASGIMYVAASWYHDTSRQRHTCVIPEVVIQFRCSWWWAKISLEKCSAAKE